MGGVMRIFMAIFGLILLPISKHSFILMLTKRLFLARTWDKKLLLLPKDHSKSHYEKKFQPYIEHKKIPCDYDLEKRKEIMKHRLIRLTQQDNVCLFIHNLVGNFIADCICPWKNKKKIMKLFNESKRKIEKEFNIIKLLKNQKLFKEIMKVTTLSDRMRYEIFHG